MQGYVKPEAHEILLVLGAINTFYTDVLGIPKPMLELPVENIIKFENFSNPGFTGDIFICLWPSGPNSMEVVIHAVNQGYRVYHSMSGCDPAYICGELFNPEDTA